MGVSSANVVAAAKKNAIPEAGGTPDYYAGYLAEVNKETGVVATEDILNTMGVLIARKGARIDHSAAQRLIQHKLAKPLEQQVRLAQTLDHKRLYEQMRQLLARYPDLRHAHDVCGFESFCKELAGWPLHPLVAQKITVLASRLPEHMASSLFCAWLGALVAREMDMDRITQRAVFLAGLTHELGFLHIDPRVAGKKGPLSPEEWRAIQCHAVIGQLFLQGIPGLDPEVARAVAEHHERCDGTGYPFAKSEGELGMPGRIIGMADGIEDLYVNRLRPRGRTVRDCVPYLQMNEMTHSSEVYRAVRSILRRSHLAPAANNPFPDIAAYADYLKQRGLALIRLRSTVAALLQCLLDNHRGGEGAGHMLTMVVSNMLVKSAAAGVAQEESFQWLFSRAGEGGVDTLPGLNELEVMQDVLVSYAANVWRTADMCCDGNDAVAIGEWQRLSPLIEEFGSALNEVRGMAPPSVAF